MADVSGTRGDRGGDRDVDGGGPPGARYAAKVGAGIGAVGGLVFVLVNAGSAGDPWTLLLRLLAAALFVVAVVLVVRAPDLAPGRQHSRSQLRAYGWIVLGEAVAIPVGASLLTDLAGLDDAALPWVVIVIGVHFVGFERVFPGARFRLLGAVLVGIGVLALLLVLLDASTDAVVVLAGVVTGFVLLGFVLRGVADGLGSRTPA